MASVPHVSLSTTRGSSSTSSFAIRAPLTPDDNDDDSASNFEFDRHGKTYDIDSGSSIYIGSESEDYVSGEEFASASGRLFIADPDEKNLEENKVKIFRPFVTNPDEESSEISVADYEESGVTDEHGSVVDCDSPVLPSIMPIAHLSLDNDEFHELSVEGIGNSELEDNSFSGIVTNCAPKVEVSGLEEDEEVELLVQMDSSVSDTELLALRDNNDFVSELVGRYHGVLSSTYCKVEVEDECHVMNARPSLEGENVDLEEISGLNEDVKNVMNDSFSADLVREFGSVSVPDGHVEALINRSFLERNREPDDNVKLYVLPFESSHQGKIALHGEDEQDPISIGDDFVDQVLDVCSVGIIKEQIGEVNVFDACNGAELHQDSGSDVPEMFESDNNVSQSSAESFGITQEEHSDSEKLGEQMGLFPDEGVEDMNEPVINESCMSFFSSPQADGIHNKLQKVDIVSEPDEELSTSFSSSPQADGIHTKAHTSQSDMAEDVVKGKVSDEEKKMIKKIQHIRVKFLRLVHRLGLSPEDSVVVQVLDRLVLAAGIHVRHNFSNVSCNRIAMQLEAEGTDALDFSLNILVMGKTGVGKSATINSIFCEKKAIINAFEPATTKVREIEGIIDGLRIRILDTPGLRTCVKEEATNRKILASIKKLMKKFPPDVVLYVDRLDTHERDLNDLSLLALISDTLTASIWQNAIVTLTHAAAPPPEGPVSFPLSFEMFAAQRSHVIQRAIRQAVGDMRLMHPVSLVENHPSCCENGSGEGVLPNGQNWRSQLLLLCYSLKILSEAIPESKTRHLFEKLPLPNLVSCLQESPSHPKLTVERYDDDVDSSIGLLALPNCDPLPPLEPWKKFQVAYILRNETKFKNLKLNKKSAGMCITLSGKNVGTGLKVKNRIAVGNRLALVGNTGAERSAAYEVNLKSKDFLLEQDETTLGSSAMKWRDDLRVTASFQSELAVSKMVIGFEMNSKQNGKIAIKTYNSELQAALIFIVPMVISILRRACPESDVKTSNLLNREKLL